MTAKISFIISAIFNVLLACALIVTILLNSRSATELALADAKARDSSSDYNLVHDLFAYSDSYLGETVRVNGYYSNSSMDENGNSSTSTAEASTLYHFLTVFDDARDCYRTIEFIPESYEELAAGDYICVVGTFSDYIEDGTTYVTLKDAEYQVIAKASDSTEKTITTES